MQQLGAEDSSITPESRAQSAFVLAVICDGHPRGQALCADAQLLAVALAHLQGARAAAAVPGPSRPAATLLLKWLCLAIGKLCEDMPEVRTHDKMPSLASGFQIWIAAAAWLSLAPTLTTQFAK